MSLINYVPFRHIFRLPSWSRLRNPVEHRDYVTKLRCILSEILYFYSLKKRKRNVLTFICSLCSGNPDLSTQLYTSSSNATNPLVSSGVSVDVYMCMSPGSRSMILIYFVLNELIVERHTFLLISSAAVLSTVKMALFSDRGHFIVSVVKT